MEDLDILESFGFYGDMVQDYVDICGFSYNDACCSAYETTVEDFRL